MEQLLCHLVGDYWLQPDWMAQNKSHGNPNQSTWAAWLVCLCHAALYTLPFVLLTRSWRVLLVISVTHWLIDYFRIGAKFSWLKNRLLGGVTQLGRVSGQRRLQSRSSCLPHSVAGDHRRQQPALADQLRGAAMVGVS